MSISVVSAGPKDKKAIIKYFKHYCAQEIAENRVECYISHNATVLAKDKERIAGILQWQIKRIRAHF